MRLPPAAATIITAERTGGVKKGTPGNDAIVGSDSSDQLFGLGGDDGLDGRVGNDVLDAGEGNDWLKGRSSSMTVARGIGWSFNAEPQADSVHLLDCHHHL
jgi:Ca2+-binding RTX toxin-like protein